MHFGGAGPIDSVVFYCSGAVANDAVMYSVCDVVCVRMTYGVGKEEDRDIHGIYLESVCNVGYA